jgi:hypothetical protein
MQRLRHGGGGARQPNPFACSMAAPSTRPMMGHYGVRIPVPVGNGPDPAHNSVVPRPV